MPMSSNSYGWLFSFQDESETKEIIDYILMISWLTFRDQRCDKFQAKYNSIYDMNLIENLSNSLFLRFQTCIPPRFIFYLPLTLISYTFKLHNKLCIDTNMNIETASQIKPPKSSSFFHLPNPRIFLLFWVQIKGLCLFS